MCGMKKKKKKKKKKERPIEAYVSPASNMS